MPPRKPSSRCEGYHSPSASVLCGQVRHLTHLRCWVVPGRDSSSSTGSVRRVPSLHSAVEYHLAAIPPHLCRGKPRQKCSGRPGHSRPGCWRRVCRPSIPQCGSQDRWPCLHASHAARHTLRGSARINVVALYFYSKVCACSRGPSYPAPTSVPRSQGEPSRLRPWRPSAAPSRRSLPLLQSPPPPQPPDRLQGHAPLRSAPYGTGRLTAAAQGRRHNPRVCETASTIGLPETPASASSRIPPASPARTTKKGV